MIMLISNNRMIMQNKTNGKISNVLGWIATIAMGLAAVALLVSFSAGK
jgi:Mn2+/Fe2+ NRAMP family transporter